MDLRRIDNRWLAVQVTVGREFATALSISRRGYQEFVPSYDQMVRGSTRTKQSPLFPGYVFVRFDAQNTHPILTSPGVVRIVGLGTHPTPIEDSEIEALQIATRSDGNCSPCAFMAIGQQVEIREGPLCGVKGRLIRWKNKSRLVISVSVLMQSVSVELDSYNAAPAQPILLAGQPVGRFADACAGENS
ncbi:MAG: transcription termination/antitermination protein NusG [Candidatus Sulfotelmatobacter sp.]